MQKAKIWPFK